MKDDGILTAEVIVHTTESLDEKRHVVFDVEVVNVCPPRLVCLYEGLFELQERLGFHLRGLWDL